MIVYKPNISGLDAVSLVTINGTANGLSVDANQVLTLELSSGSTTGALSSTDWTTFNGKQAAGNYITALTGDGTASGPGSAALTLATVNSNVGSFGSATAVSTFAVNGKGLITAAGTTSIQIAESQVTNLVTDLAGKQPIGNYITALTGDVTASGPGSSAATLATVNSNVGSFTSANVTVNAKGLVTAAANGTIFYLPTATIAASSIDWSASQLLRKTLSTNTTFTFANAASGQSIQVLVTNPATYTITWPATIQWAGGVIPTPSTGGATDIYMFTFDGTTYYGNKVQGFTAYMTATGGTITTDGDYKVHTFLSSGSFTVTSGSGNVDTLVVGAGGGGGSDNGGGGGAGSVIYTLATPLSNGSVSTVTVGAGGSGGTSGNRGTSGSNSVFGAITATGGGGGGGDTSGQRTGANGGSGGGGAGNSNSAGGTGTTGGNNGGTGYQNGGTSLGGGGGGASVAGENANNTVNVAGAGGNGLSNSISGSSVTYGGGGGGGAQGVSSNAAPGGTGGGGAGGYTPSGTAPVAGTANTGGGGGGGRNAGGAGANGGSGIVIVRYKFQ